MKNLYLIWVCSSSKSNDQIPDLGIFFLFHADGIVVVLGSEVLIRAD
jgi:hypothetical protein